MNMHLQGGVAKGDRRPNAGVDVSKHHLDVCFNGQTYRVANDAQGWDELTAMLRQAHVDLIVLEATGAMSGGCCVLCNPRSCAWRE